MYCSNCGNEINEHAIVCVKCGCAIEQQQPIELSATPKTNALAIVGFVLAFFMPLAGLICSIFGYKRADKEFGGNCKGLALAGTIISAITLAIVVAFVLIELIALFFVASLPELVMMLLLIFAPA